MNLDRIQTTLLCIGRGGMAGLAAVAGTLAMLVLLVPVAARSDVRFDQREISWSVRAQPPERSSLLRMWVRDGMRRIESEELLDHPDSTRGPAARFIQIDRVDRDSSYLLLPSDSLVGAVPFSRSRERNREQTAAIIEATANGTAPPDTLPPVSVTELKKTRKFLGLACRGFVLELRFDYRDSIPGNPGTHTQGVLTDTVWIAPETSPLGEVMRFERSFARATAADSFLAAASAVQLSQVRGQGLVSVLQREARKLPGITVASHYVNVMLGLPKGLGGVERREDGSVLIQSAVREPVRLETSAIDGAQFEVPPGYKRQAEGDAPR